MVLVTRQSSGVMRDMISTAGSLNPKKKIDSKYEYKQIGRWADGHDAAIILFYLHMCIFAKVHKSLAKYQYIPVHKWIIVIKCKENGKLRILTSVLARVTKNSFWPEFERNCWKNGRGSIKMLFLKKRVKKTENQPEALNWKHVLLELGPFPRDRAMGANTFPAWCDPSPNCTALTNSSLNLKTFICFSFFVKNSKNYSDNCTMIRW